MARTHPTPAQRRYLERGLDQPGGKLPLFDGDGQRISPSTVQVCLRQGWVEPWFANPIKPEWLVCKLTARGRAAAEAGRARARPRPSAVVRRLHVAELV